MDARVTKTLKITTPSDFEIEMTREFDAPRRLVFRAMTRPEYVKRWLGCAQNPMVLPAAMGCTYQSGRPTHIAARALPLPRQARMRLSVESQSPK